MQDMHEAAGNQRFIAQSIDHLREQLAHPTPELYEAIAAGIGSQDSAEIEKKRVECARDLEELAQQSATEPPRKDRHYVSRFDGVGIFQSAVSKVLATFPGLQGYGDWNPLWIITEFEVFAHSVKSFLGRVHQDESGKAKPAWAAVLTELIRIKRADDRAPYPPGMPDSFTIPDHCVVALLADWGGDNDAAKKVAEIARKQQPDIAIHLGDIYYGGTESECKHFLNLWPMRQDMEDPESPIHTDGSWALNGNHEMYSGGEYFFRTVLPAFRQKQPFFLLENDSWRIIGLDTAYADGRLKPQSEQDPIAAQWNWLVATLRGSRKATILLTHHQPVSAHREEFKESEPLREDVDALLAVDGVGDDAIFGWFFGHEHRCAIYRNSALRFNARLIGNGCIPHEVQKENAADPGCTQADFFNKTPSAPGADTAASCFAKLMFDGPRLAIEYINETDQLWGREIWDAEKRRLEGDPADRFKELDGGPR
jgi:Calcineurin-like phosphoesterase